jgi:NADH-quinone oxidoreductase subunit L
MLAALAIFGGLLGLPGFIGPFHALAGWLEAIYGAAEHGLAEPHLALSVEIMLLLVSSLVAIGGIFVAYLFYIWRPTIPQALARHTRPLFALLANKYYVDEKIYGPLIVQPARKLAEAMANGIDKFLIDGILVDGSAKVIGWFGRQTGSLQSGYLRHYVLATFIGVLFVIGYFFLQ